jgi:carbamoylphosphate synthase large subunit
VRALIVDPGAGRSALAGCRALAAAGWRVGIAAPSASIAMRSRWADAFHPVPPAHGEGFVDAVAAACAASGYEVVLPAGDAEAVALSAGRHRLAAALPYPPHDVVLRAFDKVAVAAIATECGMLVPRVPEPGELPAVVKARTHAGGRHEGALVRTQAELDAAAERLRGAGAEIVLQEVVPGALLAVAFVADARSEVVVQVHQRASRVWPVEAGVSTRAETIAPVPDLAAAVERFSRALGWVGLAQLQFLVPEDGRPRLIDCNGRLYGSLALALAAGVNLPALWAAADPGARPAARLGCRYQWLEGDLRRAFEERRGGLVRDVGETLAYAVGAQHSILDVRDPQPAVAQALALAGRAVRKAHR